MDDVVKLDRFLKKKVERVLSCPNCEGQLFFINFSRPVGYANFECMNCSIVVAGTKKENINAEEE